jgi:hypothetical protein
VEAPTCRATELTVTSDQGRVVPHQVVGVLENLKVSLERHFLILNHVFPFFIFVVLIVLVHGLPRSCCRDNEFRWYRMRHAGWTI